MATGPRNHWSIQTNKFEKLATVDNVLLLYSPINQRLRRKACSPKLMLGILRASWIYISRVQILADFAVLPGAYNRVHR